MLRYRHEFEHRLRVAVVGCGGQAFRNILPAFNYAPVDLVATCDQSPGRASAYAGQFGARESYSDIDVLLREQDLDAVFLLTGFGPHGRPQYPEQAARVLEAGRHVWIEKPPAASVEEVELMREASLRAGKQVGVGFMKVFSPGVRRLRELMSRPDFGRPTTMYYRDPEMLPEESDIPDPTRWVYLLDHLAHPASVINHLMGPVRAVYARRAANGAGLISLGFQNGAEGVLHMPWGQSGMSPQERVEIVGEGANAVLDNNSCLTYYRPGHPGEGPFQYGRVGDYTGPAAEGPLRWAIDNYSGQPFNMHLFSQGYAPEVIYFCEHLLSGRPITVGGLADAWHVTRLFEAVRDAGRDVVELAAPPAWTLQGVDARGG